VLVPPVKPKKTAPGITWKLYKGNYPWVPHVYHLHPSETGEAPKPGVKMVDGKANEVVAYQGYLKIPEDGQYTFYLKTDTGGELRIHDATVIDADYNYWGGVWKRGSIRLKAGLHPFRLYYRRGSQVVSPSLQFQWTKPDKRRRLYGGVPIPAKVFRH
jgi:hypothetical protein